LARCQEFLLAMDGITLLPLFQAVAPRADLCSETLACAAWLACATTLSRALVPCFPLLVACADPDDETLAAHLTELLQGDCAAVTAPLVVHGCDRVAVHVLHLLLGDGYAHDPTTKLGAAVERVVRAYGVRPPFAHALADDGAKRTVPTDTVCPITLEGMHCPVVASDGHTYELEAIVRVARTGTTFRSPLTREPLATWVAYNRALVVASE
jgi:hypothetical protein